MNVYLLLALTVDSIGKAFYCIWLSGFRVFYDKFGFNNFVNCLEWHRKVGYTSDKFIHLIMQVT